jgi:hypothetical protein
VHSSHTPNFAQLRRIERKLRPSKSLLSTFPRDTTSIRHFLYGSLTGKAPKGEFEGYRPVKYTRM